MRKNDVVEFCFKKGIRPVVDGSVEPANYSEGVNCSNADTVRLLTIMAIRGICPDGNFSDYECSMWSIIRSTLRAEGVKVKEF